VRVEAFSGRGNAPCEKGVRTNRVSGPRRIPRSPAPPFENWVEDDSRVKFAPAPEKAAKRVAVRQELQSASASVKGVGSLRLTMDANLSDYDPTYSEFVVRALAPSSMVTFSALGQKISVSFANGRTAQIWRVPAAEAQAIRDKVSSTDGVELDVLLAIDSALPSRRRARCLGSWTHRSGHRVAIPSLSVSVSKAVIGIPSG
jgi:hypothetical protein